MLIFEDLRTTRRRKVFAVEGVDCFVTPYAWLSGPFFLVLGTVCAFVQQRDLRAEGILLTGAVCGLLLFGSNAVHTLGHVVAGRIAGSPDGAVLITATFHVNSHRCDPAICTRWTHLGRSAGGPISHLALALVAMPVNRIAGGEWLDFLAKANLVLALWFLLPVPSLDGWVIWGELLGFRRRAPGEN